MVETPQPSIAHAGSGHPLTFISVLGVVAFIALFVREGADLLWLVAVGDAIREQGSVPDGIPFAAANTEEWPNVLVLAELLLSVVHDGGTWALPAFQLVATTTVFSVLALDARSWGASDRAMAGVLALVALGSLPSLVIVRLQMLSLVPFAVLLLLLRAQHRRPTTAIWLLPLLVAVWTNLHGAVLLGVAVAGAYLLFSRLQVRTVETLIVGPVTLLALLATPAGLSTIDYYRGVMENEAANRGSGLWAHLDLSQPFDVVLVLCAGVLVIAALRRRLPLWEYVVLAGLAVATIIAARNGVWLLMVVAVPAAVAFSRIRNPNPTSSPRLLAVMPLAGLLVSLALIAPRGDQVLSDDPETVRDVVEIVADRVVLAPEPLAESLAVAGVTLWAADPIDAFEPEVQVIYMDFVDDGEVAAALPDVDAVVVRKDSPQHESMTMVTDFEARTVADDWLVYLRR